MIDDYMPIRLNLPDDTDVCRIAEAVKIDDDAAVGKLIRVWAWAQKNSVDGTLNATARVVDRIAGCRGFSVAMCSVGWLSVDEAAGTISIPKWEKWNSKAAKKRAYNRDKQRDFRGQYGYKSLTNVTANGLQTDNGEEEEEEEEEIQVQEEKQVQEQACAGLPNGKPRASDAAPSDRAADVRSVFAHYRTHHPKAFPKPHSKMNEWRKIAARLAEGYSVADLYRAIDGNHKSPFHCGENDRQKEYHSLELIVRSADKVSQFMELADDNRPVLSEKTQRTKRAADSYLARRFAEMEGEDAIHEG